MKNNTLLICLAVLCTGIAACNHVSDPVIKQKKIVLAPVNNPSEINVGIYNSQDYSSGGTVELPLSAWTIHGIPVTVRSLLKFDLDKIPATASVITARLILYSDTIPINGDLLHANYGTDNTVLIQRVAEQWTPGSVTWFNQPATVTTSQATVPSTPQAFKNLNVDVTSMVSTMVASKKNYGFKLVLHNAVIYTSRIFCSSYYPDTSRRPRLEITYKETVN